MRRALDQAIGARIVQARMSLGLSQIDLCRKLDIRSSSLSKIENGCRNTSAHTMARISKALGVSCDYLTGTDVDKSNERVNRIMIDFSAMSDSDKVFVERVFTFIKKERMIYGPRNNLPGDKNE